MSVTFCYRITTAATFVHWLSRIRTPTCFGAQSPAEKSKWSARVFAFIVVVVFFFHYISRKSKLSYRMYFPSVRITQITAQMLALRPIKSSPGSVQMSLKSENGEFETVFDSVRLLPGCSSALVPHPFRCVFGAFGRGGDGGRLTPMTDGCVWVWFSLPLLSLRGHGQARSMQRYGPGFNAWPFLNGISYLGSTLN